jgi:hypothetical protein
MFVIPCKYSLTAPYIISLVENIRNFHPNEKIVVVDSNSEDKTYFEKINRYEVLIEDIANKHWMVGAFWHSFKKYPDEDFYYFLHDSMKVKDNLEYLKSNALTLLCYFNRAVHSSFSGWAENINKYTNFVYTPNGKGCYGPAFFCQNYVMKNLLKAGVDKLLPSNKIEVGFAEGAYGFFFEQLGFDLENCSLFGDILSLESSAGKSGTFPHNTTWQYPIEKFYGHYADRTRL